MHLIRFLWRYSWRREGLANPWLIGLALVAGFVSGGCSAGLIGLISRTVSAVDAPGAAAAATFILLGLVALMTAALSRILLVRFSQAVVFGLQTRLCRQVLATELKPLEDIGLPRLLAVLTEDIQAIATAAGVVPIIAINIASAVGCMVYISWLSWQVLGLVLLLTLVASVSCRWFLVRGRRSLSVARKQQDRLFQHFRSLVDGVKELKLKYYGQQDFLNNDLEQSALAVKHSNTTGLSLFAILDSWGKFIYFFAMGLILFLLPYWLPIPVETRFAYVLTFTYLLGPMESLVNKLPFLSKASIALQKIETLGLSLEKHTSAIAAPATPTETSTDNVALQVKGATHQYRGDYFGRDGERQRDYTFTLGPVDLSVSSGELVFIVGGNGSGKSTLAKLLCGLYQPQSGQIWLNGEAIEPHNQQWYRQHFSAVFSDFYLFERVLGNEALAAADEISDARSHQYLKALQLDHKVQIQHGRFSTTALSQGQRKRLALLSAALDDRPIYLFDEWAADQDPTFKRIFYTQILADLKAKSKIIFVISHDDRYFHLADRLIKLDYGTIVYSGPPSESALKTS
ncbi:MAG: cyclic peptide export ABC transporter [Cyanobacteria bacterium P01_D01_bin.105]